MKTKKIISALILVIIAVAVILSALGLMRGSIGGIIFLLILIGASVKLICDKNVDALIPISLIPFVLIKFNFLTPDLIGESAYTIIDKITPWSLLIAAILIDIALKMVLGKPGKKVTFNNSIEYNSDNIKNKHQENFTDGNWVEVSNTFGESVKYVNASNFTSADISNSFGSTKVYFDNAVISPDGATIRVKNSFGEIIIQVPSSWNTVVKKSSVFGAVNERGRADVAVNDATCTIFIDNVFGEVNVIRC